MEVNEQFNQLLGSVYQGALEEPPWQSFLAAMRDYLQADLVTLLLRPPSLEDQVVMLADGGSLSAIKSYNEGQFVLDPFVGLPPGEVFSLQQYLSGDKLEHSEFFSAIMEPQGWYDFLGVDLREEGELDVRFRAGRYCGSPAFTATEKNLLGLLAPHLERAIRLYTRISRTERERAVYAGAVAQLRVATIILDEVGEVLSTNAAAEQLLATGESIRLVARKPTLVSPAAHEELLQLLDAVRRGRREPGPGTAAAMQIPATGTAEGLGLIARAVPPAPGAEGRGIPSIVLFISDPTQAAEPQQQIVSRLFDLTPTEARLALLLANGLSLDEVSAELAISRNTARTHLRAVFSKTGVTRQAGLVRLILRSVAPLAGEVEV